MRFKILGCSGGIGKGLRTSSFLIDDNILLDAGTGVSDLTLDQIKNLRHIFLTHSHLDHVCSIPLLIDTVFDSLTEPLNIYGRRETIAALKEHVFNWTLWPDFSELPSKNSAVMEYQIITPGDEIEIDGKTISMVDVNHAVPAAAFYVESGSSRICYTGDTATCYTLWNFLNKMPPISLLVVECGFPNEDKSLAALAKHYCPDTLSTDLKKLKQDTKIAITHLKPGSEEATKKQIKALIPDRNIVFLKSGEVFNFQ